MNDLAAVTGASRGIGRATALALAKRGYRVFALARSEDDLARLAEAAGAFGGIIEPVVLDIADDASRRAAAARIETLTQGRGVDVLVNNAGYGQLGPLEEVSVEQLRRQFEVNVVGLHGMTQFFLPGMRERRRGWVINVSSVAGRVSTPFMGAYNASKFALEGLSDAMRLELAPFGVHVVLIEPGPIRTGFGEAAKSHSRSYPDSPYARFTQRWSGAKNASHLLSRSADDVAAVILRAVQLNHPRPRYSITIQARFGNLARRVAPDIVSDWVIRTVGGLR